MTAITKVPFSWKIIIRRKEHPKPMSTVLACTVLWRSGKNHGKFQPLICGGSISESHDRVWYWEQHAPPDSDSLEELVEGL
jgi:hypothetical protein